MPDIEKVLEKDEGTKVFENDIFNLNVDFTGNPNSLECFSNLWENLAERNITTEKIIGSSEYTFYFMQLYSNKGNDYIRRQLRILGGQL